MKRNSTIGLCVLAIIALGALAVWPKIEDKVRDYQYQRHLEAKKENPHAWSPSFFETEDTPDGWLKALDQCGAKRIGKLGSEAYRMLIARMGRSGVITVVLNGEPHWEEAVLGEPKRNGTLTRRQAARIRSMVSRCHFWEIGDYIAGSGADGETWVFEGFRHGRYRRITDWCPERTTYVFALCSTIADATDPSLTRNR